MTLFDKRPLTEIEVKARVLCECGATYGEHGVFGKKPSEIAEMHARYHAGRPAASCGDRCRFDASRWCERTRCRRFKEARA